ncbi:hypothetical protein RJ641_008917 [Dillenia turbinata]|uniref:Uncharacterized protein n=1 Tax=Dillenia turbinata TaxID=194707 RepID=A0AAN8V6U9_9MAGN
MDGWTMNLRKLMILMHQNQKIGMMMKMVNERHQKLITPNIWTRQDGILFDNILIASDEKTAATYRDTTSQPKFQVEKEKQKAEYTASSLSDGLSGLQKKVFDLLYKIAEIPFLEADKLKILDLIEKGEKQPNITICILVSTALILLTVFFRLIFGGKKTVKLAETSNVGDAGTSRSQEHSEEREQENYEEDTSAPRRRSIRHET